MRFLQPLLQPPPAPSEPPQAAVRSRVRGSVIGSRSHGFILAVAPSPAGAPVSGQSEV